MPSLGADMTDGVLVKWRVTEGGRVTQGDIIAEVETDKGTIEVEVFETGIVRRLLVSEGEKVPVGTPLAEIAEDARVEPPEGETLRAPPSPSEPVTKPSPTAPTTGGDIMTLGPAPDLDGPVASPSVRKRAQQLDVRLDSVRGTGRHGRITLRDIERHAAPPISPQRPSNRLRISPYARRLAASRRVEVAALTGTGPGGAIRAADVEKAPIASSAPSAGERMRRAVAAAMARANREIPHYYVDQIIDVEPALEWMAARNAELSVTHRLVAGVLLLRAVALTLRKHPEFNASWQDDVVVPREGVHVGLAVSLRGGGLVAPVVRDAATGTLVDLMERMHDLVARARGGTLRSSEMAGAGITLTALGERGVDRVTPIIFPPQVAIVGVGAIRRRPWVVDGQVVPRQVVSATLGADHRATNGHRGARFLRTLDRVLQTPEEL